MIKKFNVRTLVSVLLASTSLALMSTASAQETSEAESDEIVVTALKTSQTLQDVPAAVAVIDSERLTALGVTNLTQVGNLSSGVSVTPVRTQAFIFMRGVGQTLTTPNADAAVAANLNGVYLPAEIAGVAFFDAERIEMLPGPQGTLYGRNSTGGVVNIESRMPGDEFAINGSIEVGNYEALKAVLGMDVPLGDTLASRTALTLNRHDGYFNNGLEDQDSYAARQTLVWSPSNATRITGIVGYSHDGGYGATLQNIPSACGVRCASFDPEALGYFNRVNVFQGSLRVDHDFSSNTSLTYIGGYNRLGVDVRNSIFTDGVSVAPLIFNEHIEGQSHELRLNHSAGAFESIVGLYFFDQDTRYLSDARPTPAQHVITPFNASADGAAVFGQVSYALSDALRLTGGLRYSQTNKDIDGYNETRNGADVLVSLYNYTGDYEITRADWKGGVEFDLTEDSMIYANISTGFSPGGFSNAPSTHVGPAPLPAAPFEPVTLTAYVLGIKNRLPGNLGTLNFEGFYYDYSDYQVSARDLNGENIVYNAEQATVYGVEASANLRLSAHDDLSLSATYLHAVADELRAGVGIYDGFTLPYSPEWTFNAYYQHIWNLSHGAEIRGSVNFKYTDDRWSVYTHAAPGYLIEANTRTDLNLGYFAPDEAWSLNAFVRNLEDDDVKTTCARALPGPAGCNFEAPQTYGLRLDFSF